MTRAGPVVALALCAVVVLQGCTFIRLAYWAEVERLQVLSAWKDRLAVMDCAQLGAEYTDLLQRADDLVDREQRSDILRDRFDARGCQRPAGLD